MHDVNIFFKNNDINVIIKKYYIFFTGFQVTAISN